MLIDTKREFIYTDKGEKTVSEKLTDIFGMYVFNDSVMKERLPRDTYMKLKEIMDNRGELTIEIANIVADAMKEWAVEKGATHYTHWFQPMTGITAEKHDSFIEPAEDGKVLMEFSGKELIKGEPDASSFPNGGLRETFEARGYTAWDCTSPAFLRENAAGLTLCIPTAFVSYKGEALDKKTPLLRSMQAVSNQALRILRLFGDTETKHVDVSVGVEQEYFIVDRKNYKRREDLIMTGRTLFGAPAPKGQELDDHYFGTLKERIAVYMQDLNRALWKLGIYAKTQHNEVAPAQHELAPIYESANVATDHNQLVMDAMKKEAKRHGLKCLLAEKPFKGVNGSGKHDNWSLVTDKGVNLIKPGSNPDKNTQFLLFLAAILEAVDTYPEILRLSASNPGNDHRLGAQEAPPAIISVFLGDQLEDVVEQIISKGEAKSSLHAEKLLTGVSSLPTINKDATDRNRTSPFAFTGNKFEFRMVGASASVAEANTYLNTMVAEILQKYADELEKSENFDEDVKKVICRALTEHQRIIFNGNGYSEEWVKEAERRGLPNLRAMVDAIGTLADEKSVKLFEHQGVLSEAEIKSRVEIGYENYAKIINIEAKTMIDMASKLYIPGVARYVKVIADSINSVRTACPAADVSAQEEILLNCSTLLARAQKALDDLKTADAKAISIADKEECAKFFKEDVCARMEALRAPIDELEVLVEKAYWPVPAYSDLMFDI